MHSAEGSGVNEEDKKVMAIHDTQLSMLDTRHDVHTKITYISY
jgi:hypothetical protein